MALILNRVGKQKEALAFLSCCMRLEKNNILFFQEYIKTLIKLGQIKEARNHFEAHRKNFEMNDQLNSLYLELNCICFLN